MTALDAGSGRGRDAVPPGLPDHLFTRGEAPMTKAEVRAVTISAARLLPAHRVIDVGAGTGSMTVEAALLCPEGGVVAVERDPAALEVLRLNVERFGLDNVIVVDGYAPDVFVSAPFTPASFDCVLVGGSGGKMAIILEEAAGLLVQAGLIVCNTICLETTATVAAALRRPPWTAFSCSQVAVSRGVPAGPLLRFEALNPVWVTTAALGGAE
jgi:cobalt-precorrin-6B (C15)-methyltransferase